MSTHCMALTCLRQAEQAVLESIIRQRRSTLISPHLRLSGSANPHIYVSQASISDFKPTATSRRRSSTVSTGPILIPVRTEHRPTPFKKIGI